MMSEKQLKMFIASVRDVRIMCEKEAKRKENLPLKQIILLSAETMTHVERALKEVLRPSKKNSVLYEL